MLNEDQIISKLGIVDNGLGTSIYEQLNDVMAQKALTLQAFWCQHCFSNNHFETNQYPQEVYEATETISRFVANPLRMNIAPAYHAYGVIMSLIIDKNIASQDIRPLVEEYQTKLCDKKPEPQPASEPELVPPPVVKVEPVPASPPTENTSTVDSQTTDLQINRLKAITDQTEALNAGMKALQEELEKAVQTSPELSGRDDPPEENPPTQSRPEIVRTTAAYLETQRVVGATIATLSALALSIVCTLYLVSLGHVEAIPVIGAWVDTYVKSISIAFSVMFVIGAGLAHAAPATTHTSHLSTTAYGSKPGNDADTVLTQQRNPINYFII